MPQSWPESSGGLAPKRGPGNFDRARPHCLLRSSATMDVASNWENWQIWQNSALEIFSDGGVAACSSALFFIIFIAIHLLICGRLLIQPLRSALLRPASPGRAAASPGGRSGICPHCPMASPSLPGSEFICNLLCHNCM